MKLTLFLGTPLPRSVQCWALSGMPTVAAPRSCSWCQLGPWPPTGPSWAPRGCMRMFGVGLVSHLLWIYRSLIPLPGCTNLMVSAVSAWLCGIASSGNLGQINDALQDMALRRHIWSGCQGSSQPGRGQEELACAAVLV